MTARRLVRILERLGARRVRQSGSHVRYVSSCGKCATTVAMHAGDIPPGTLRAIEQDMVPCLGKGWMQQ